MPGYATMSEAKRAAILDYVLNHKPPSPSRPEPGAPAPKVIDKQPPAYAFGGFRRWLDDEGYPAIKPPWGTLNAVDLNTGKIKWKVVLGEYPELTARGIPPTGTENYGGPLVTASGLIFIGATADEAFRVFDKENGKTLFKAKLPFSGTATPSTPIIPDVCMRRRNRTRNRCRSQSFNPGSTCWRCQLLQCASIITTAAPIRNRPTRTVGNQ